MNLLRQVLVGTLLRGLLGLISLGSFGQKVYICIFILQEPLCVAREKLIQAQHENPKKLLFTRYMAAFIYVFLLYIPWWKRMDFPWNQLQFKLKVFRIFHFIAYPIHIIIFFFLSLLLLMYSMLDWCLGGSFVCITVHAHKSYCNQINNNNWRTNGNFCQLQK